MTLTGCFEGVLTALASSDTLLHSESFASLTLPLTENVTDAYSTSILKNPIL